MTTRYDVVWYWDGGTERGMWRGASIATGKTAQDVVQEINRAGRVAFAGLRSIGAPEGPPARHDFVKIGMVAT